MLQAVQSTNYIPNNSARALKTANSRSIAVLAKTIINPFFHKLICIIEHEVNFRGYTVILQNINGVTDEIDSAIELAQDRNLCGVIIMGGRFSYSKESLERLGIPCVLLTVSAGEDRKIGFVYHGNSDIMWKTPNDYRFYGYCRALNESGIPIDPTLYDFGNLVAGSGYAVGYDAMQRLYAAHPEVTAVFTFSDELAILTRASGCSQSLVATRIFCTWAASRPTLDWPKLASTTGTAIQSASGSMSRWRIRGQ